MSTIELPTQRPQVWKYHPWTLEGKRAIVTGGTTGSGRTITLLLASLGARVVFFGRHETTLREALDDLSEYRDRVIGLRADASVEADLDVVFTAVDEQLGGLDILVNNAGLPAGSILDEDPDQYRKVVETNLLGTMSAAKRAVPRMRSAGGGRIVNIGSMSAEKKGKGSDVYTATKSGLRGFCESLAKQVAEDGIHVGLIEPGKFGADFRVQSPREEREEEAKGELLFSEAIAEAVLYMLTTPANCHIPFLQIQPLGQQGG